MADQPTTPTRPEHGEEGSEREVRESADCVPTIPMANSAALQQDDFDDADEMATPRAVARTASSDNTRSLTGRQTPVIPGPPEPLDEHESAEVHPEVHVQHEEAQTHSDGAAKGALADNRFSVTSMMDVNLEEGEQQARPKPSESILTESKQAGADSQNAPSDSRRTTQSSIPTIVSTPSRPTSPVKVMQETPAQMPLLSQPTPQPIPIASPAPSVSSRFRSPFSWLSRNTPSAEKIASPPLSPPDKDASGRRGTMSSITSGAELNLSKIDHADDSDMVSQHRNSRSNLRDRFKLLRMREEAGVHMPDETPAPVPATGGPLAGLLGRSVTSIGLGIGNAVSASVSENGDDSSMRASPIERVSSNPITGSLQRQPAINKDLAPGTASGASSAPPAAPVDWDLWQSVVYEGPAAVARTSPEELTQAIAAGIPQAIRGVVWQVLSKSQNADLEALYHELVARGTEKEKKPHSVDGHRQSGSDSSKEKESIRSSASSTHSQNSTPATTPAILSDDDAASMQASLTAARSRSRKDDAAKVQKLEKVIKRDLGARTSYSKYFMSAGLQDGLFGICKAYALYDEEVGYAQGMNFIAMPLLFNVSIANSID